MNFEGTWTNMNDGSALSWTNWNGKEPNNHGSGENHAHIILTDGNNYDKGRNGLWNDITSKDHQDVPFARIAYGDNNAFICVRDLP